MQLQDFYVAIYHFYKLILCIISLFLKSIEPYNKKAYNFHLKVTDVFQNCIENILTQ